MLAFTDTWKWTPDAAQQYKECTAAGNPQAAALEWFQDILGESGALAYLVHMAARFPELHRMLGPAGGLFLHVDETMSHYLKSSSTRCSDAETSPRRSSGNGPAHTTT